jgi:hypothetical protein
VSPIVYGCMGAQGVCYANDYINNLLMSQPLGMAGREKMRVGRMGLSAQGGFRTGGTAYGVAEPSVGGASRPSSG